MDVGSKVTTGWEGEIDARGQPVSRLHCRVHCSSHCLVAQWTQWVHPSQVTSCHPSLRGPSAVVSRARAFRAGACPLSGLSCTNDASLHGPRLSLGDVHRAGLSAHLEPEAAGDRPEVLPTGLPLPAPSMSLAEHDPNSADWQGYSDPERPVVGTALTVHTRPGARKPGPKPGKIRAAKRKAELTKAQRHDVDKVRADLQRSFAREDFGRRTQELVQQGFLFAEIAVQMSEERGEVITLHRVKVAYDAHMKNYMATDKTRHTEVAKMESAAAKLWKQIIDMEDDGPNVMDVEVYVKAVEAYVKVRERIAKLLGLDAAVKQHVTRDGANPGAGLAIDLDANGLHIRMPGSINAVEEWQRLSDLGLTELAADVIELEAGDHAEVGVDDEMFREDGAAGVTLRPQETAPKAERVQSAIEALEALKSR